MFVTPVRVVLTQDKKWPYMVDGGFEYHTKIKKQCWSIKIDHGFLTDFASVPRIPFVFSMFGDLHGTRGAAVIHDACYRHALFSRKESDDIFLEAMLVSGASRWKARIMYYAVRVFGGILGGYDSKEDPLAHRGKIDCRKI
jgi:hypothetical protein